jgi:hypothetical protein
MQSHDLLAVLVLPAAGAAGLLPCDEIGEDSPRFVEVVSSI